MPAHDLDYSEDPRDIFLFTIPKPYWFLWLEEVLERWRR